MPTKILSVDDENDLELLLTQYFRRKIRSIRNPWLRTRISRIKRIFFQELEN